MNPTASPIILASSSPRRRELLAQLGVRFGTASPDVDESRQVGEAPLDYVQRLAVSKAKAVAHAADGALVIGSDTSVVLGDRILGKPVDFADFRSMMESLSASRHAVMTAVAMVAGEQTGLCTSVSRVWFRGLTMAEIRRYWDSGEPLDKAGGYAIQGKAAAFVERLDGSYSGVMGLPLFETAELLGRFGVDVWNAEKFDE